MSDPRRIQNGRRHVPAALLSLLLLLGTAGPALAVDGVIEINQARALAGGITPGDSGGFPVTINAPGSYRLTGNLLDSPPGFPAIRILTDHVTLDLNGFSIIGDPTGTDDGIEITGSDVEIRNGSISSFGGRGVFAPLFYSFIRVIGVSVMDNAGSGLELQGDGNIVDGCTARNNQLGIRVGTGSLVTNSVIRGNTFFGLVGLGAPANAGFRSNVITGNNGGDANPQTANGLQLGSNVCGTDLVCP